MRKSFYSNNDVVVENDIRVLDENPDMGFEEFQKGSFRGASTETVTLRQSGSIGISKAVVEEYFDNVDGVVLHYDEENSLIGLEPENTDNNSNAYSLNDSQGSGSIQASSLMKRYGLTPEETTAFEPTWDDDKGLLIVDVDEAI